MIQSVDMSQQLVVARNVGRSHFLCGSNAGTLDTLAGIFKRSGNEPAFLVLIYLVNTYLVTLAPVLEAGVIDEVGASVGSGNDGVVALRALAVVLQHVAPAAIGPGDVPTTYADASALERDFGFTPKITLREGLRKFAEWYKAYYQ